MKKDKNLAIVGEVKTRIKTLHTVSGMPSLYGKMKAELESKGQTLDDAELLISSIALLSNATVVTNNIEHFKRISRLKIENWR
jgi:tRNA(fMet)-specific endonuclease VapC